MVKELEGQSEAIIDNCIELTYFMRGSIQYREFMDLTPMEKKRISKFLEERMKIEGKRHNPVY